MAVVQGHDGDAIYIEGDLDKIRTMLKDWLSVLDGIEDHEREQFDKTAAELTQCPWCRCWRKLTEVHADGKGGECKG